MARYNHFSKPKYKTIPFSDISVGAKFRKNFKPFRRDIVCVKTGDLEYTEQGNKKVHTPFCNDFMVYSYDALNLSTT